MNKNLGVMDRAARIFLAFIIWILIQNKTFSSTIAIILGILAGYLVLTCVIGICPLYYPLRIGTIGKKKKSKSKYMRHGISIPTLNLRQKSDAPSDKIRQ
jgi:hypothetical protein